MDHFCRSLAFPNSLDLRIMGVGPNEEDTDVTRLHEPSAPRAEKGLMIGFEKVSVPSVNEVIEF